MINTFGRNFWCIFLTYRKHRNIHAERVAYVKYAWKENALWSKRPCPKVLAPFAWIYLLLKKKKIIFATFKPKNNTFPWNVLKAIFQRYIREKKSIFNSYEIISSYSQTYYVFKPIYSFWYCSFWMFMIKAGFDVWSWGTYCRTAVNQVWVINVTHTDLVSAGSSLFIKTYRRSWQETS